MAVLALLMLVFAGCGDWGDGFNPEDWERAGENGLVTVRIDLAPGGRFVLPTDAPGKDDITYYEAFFREAGTGRYYTGSAVRGERYIVVAVMPNRTYDILILAGAPANGQEGNGEKILLASGWRGSYPAQTGRNTAEVPMKLHKTEDCFTDVSGAAGNERRITYIPTITNVHPILTASGAFRNAGVFAGSGSARIVPYPEPYSDDQRIAPITNITTDKAGGILHFTITDTMPPNAAHEGIYSCAYNLSYYAFSDPASRSSRWNIRRGINGEMFTEQNYFGGGVPIRYDRTVYYVKSDGDDANPGSPSQPFQTLARAVQAVRSPRPESDAPWVKTIVILGELTNASEQAGDSQAVFVIPNAPAGQTQPDLIRITGDDPATPAVETTAKLSGGGTTNKRILSIAGNNTKVQLDTITITGGGGNFGGGVLLKDKAQLTITDGARIAGIVKSGGGDLYAGAGVRVEDAKLFMYGGEVADNHVNEHTGNGTAGGIFITGGGDFKLYDGLISGNKAKWGGGVVVNNGTFTMYGGNIAGNETWGTNNDGGYTTYGAGVTVHNGSTFIMSGGSITGNQSTKGQTGNSGGGGVWVGGTFRMSGAAEISGGNTSWYRGGGVIVKDGGTFYLDTAEGAKISGNTAGGGDRGDNVYRHGNGVFELNGVAQTNANFNDPIN